MHLEEQDPLVAPEVTQEDQRIEQRNGADPNVQTFVLVMLVTF
jgi:hypothetical protein